jgi:hypothetical protein
MESSVRIAELYACVRDNFQNFSLPVYLFIYFFTLCDMKGWGSWREG